MNMVLVNFVSYYAAEVRGALSGLSQDVIDDLTDGLEADLIDAMADGQEEIPAQDITLNHLIERFGKPSQYASELVSAAGLDVDVQESPIAAPQRQSLRARVQGQWSRGLSRTQKTLSAQKWWPALRSFFLELRPVWWVLRAVPVYAFFVRLESSPRQFVPRDLPHLLFFAIIVVGSVILGRQSMRGAIRGNWAKALTVVNVMLVVSLLPLSSHFVGASGRQYSNGYSTGYNAAMEQFYPSATQAPPLTDSAGVLTGMDSELFYVYDEHGEYVPNARIVTQQGDPLDNGTYPVRVDVEQGVVEISTLKFDEFGALVRNVYPAGRTVVEDGDYCTSEAQAFWEMVATEGRYSLESPAHALAPFHYNYDVDGETERFIYLADTDAVTPNSECYLGIKVQAQTQLPAAPWNRLPALGSPQGTDQSPSTDGSKGSPQSSGGPIEPSTEDATKPSTEPENLDTAALDAKLVELKKALEEAKTAKDDAKVKEINALIADVNKQKADLEKADLEKADLEKAGQNKPETPASRE